MPYQKQVVETYLTICYWKVRVRIRIWFIKINRIIRIPYLCFKKRTVTKTCYKFEVWTETCVGFVAKHTACENGRKYSWWAPCFGVGKTVHLPQEKCFDGPLDDEGVCDLGKVSAPGDLPDSYPYGTPTYAGILISVEKGE